MRTTYPRASRDKGRICAVLSLCGLTFYPHTPAHAGLNPQVTFVLHAQPGYGGTCTAAPAPNCDAVQPTVVVQPNTPYQVFLYLNNVNGVAGVQTAFAWDAGWDLLGSTWNCQASQLTATTPDANSANGGSTAGT